MIEEIVLNYLDNHLSVPVYLMHQETMPTDYVLFEKTGSSEKNHLKSATFAFQSYSDSLFKAATINEEVKNLIKSITELSEVSGSYLNSDYNYTDTTTKKYRYQAVFDINYY